MKLTNALLAAHLSVLTALAQLNVSGNLAVSTPDTAPSSQSITALNGAAQVALAGQAGVGVTVSGVWTATLAPELSFDGGATWVATFFKIPNTGQYVATASANGPYAIICATGASHARVRASAFTSGTITVLLRREPGERFAAAVCGACGKRGSADHCAGGGL